MSGRNPPFGGYQLQIAARKLLGLGDRTDPARLYRPSTRAGAGDDKPPHTIPLPTWRCPACRERNAGIRDRCSYCSRPRDARRGVL